METAISGLMGQVDQGMEQRSSLVAALRAKLLGGGAATGLGPGTAEGGASPPLEPAAATEEAPMQSLLVQPPPEDSFTGKLAQYDRGLDQRQKLIDALKANLSRSAALPKTAPPRCPTEPLQATGGLLAATQMMGMGDALASPGSPGACASAASPVQAGAPFLPGPPVLVDGVLPLPGQQIDAGGPPAAKRPRGGAASDFAAPAPAPVAAAEAELLAARKAEMLRSLGAAGVAAGPQPGQPAPPQTSPGTAAIAAQSTSPGGLLGSSSPPAAPPGPGAGPPMPPLPPNATPEQFEAYRQQCWQQYYEYCAVWQKYYEKQKRDPSQAKGKSAGKGYPAGLGPGGPRGPLLGQGVAGCAAGGLGTAAALAAARAASGGGVPELRSNPALAGGQHPVDEDIHSKLLGL